MDGVFWHNAIGFVVDQHRMASTFPDGVTIAQMPIDSALIATGEVPPLGGAPLASWLLARLMHLTNERLGFEAQDKQYHDGGGFYLNFIAFSKAMKPLAFFNLHGTSAGCRVWGQCDRDVQPQELLQNFLDALIAEPDMLMPCRLQCFDTDPPDLDQRRISKPNVLGWDGKRFLGRTLV